MPSIRAAMLTPSPRMSRSTVRGAYKFRQKTQEMMAEAHEQVQDIVAEVDAERDPEPKATKAAQD